MRFMLLVIALLFSASPALAQVAAKEPSSDAKSIQLPPELTDPRTADKLASAMQALSDALLDLKVGGVEAAIQGRKATAAERRLTVRDLGRRDDPQFDRKLQQGIAEARPRIEQGLKALNEALPRITQDLRDAQKALERAAANMPDPTYPKR
jgi:hypothetical protein